MSVTHRDPIYFRVLVFRQGDQWLAQCLEHDLNAQAPSGDEALGSFMRLLKARFLRDMNNGREPLKNLPPAPDRFVDTWNRLTAKHKALTTQTLSLPDDDQASNTVDAPEAYIISQIANSGDSGVFRP